MDGATSSARAAALHLTAVVRGTAQISIDIGSAHKTDDGRARTEAELVRSLSELIDARDYPALAAVQAAETADDHHLGDGDGLPVALSFGVDRFLDGIETWAHRDS